MSKKIKSKNISPVQFYDSIENRTKLRIACIILGRSSGSFFRDKVQEIIAKAEKVSERKI